MKPHTPKDNSTPQERLLEAASHIFANEGFKAAKVRDIVDKADVNLAAVNYYYGGKEGLYAAVMRHHITLAEQQYQYQTDVTLPAEKQLFHFIHNLMRRLFDQGSPSLIARLMAWEMTDPSSVWKGVMDSYVHLQSDMLDKIIYQLVGEDTVMETVINCRFSIYGQCLLYYYSRHALRHLRPGLEYSIADIDRLTDHIYHFSRHAIHGLLVDATDAKASAPK